VSEISAAALPGPVLGLSAASGSAAGLALPGGESHQAASDQPRAHVETMIPLVEAVLGRAGLAPSELAAIAVGRGPAPYTGLRVALMTARALGFALGLPVWGVSDLDALAAGAAQRLDLPAGARLEAVLDAKRREVYWARYRVDRPGRLDGLERLVGPAVGPPRPAGAAALAIGPGAAKYAPAVGPAADAAGVDPVVLARLAAGRAARGEAEASQPLYLRRPHVQPAGGRPA
jgi:tRNA threonylcarbamoyladenosine biosynthesis protein TsaB